MTKREVIERVLRYEVDKRQSAWEMVQNGYNGDIEEYIADYASDYDAEEVTSGTFRVSHPNGCSWVVEDGEVERVIF